MVKWWKVKTLAIYVFVLGIVVEFLTGANAGHFIIDIGALLFTIGANMRLRQHIKNRRKKK